MQVHLPIAICLIRMRSDASLVLGVHQVLPERPLSVREFVDRCTDAQGGGDLLHHVVFFTSRSYAECQSSIRREVAEASGARVLGRSRVIVGDEETIASAMTELALGVRSSSQRQQRLQQQQQQRSRPSPSHAAAPSDDGSDSDESRGSLGSFIVDDDGDTEDATSSEDDPDEVMMRRSPTPPRNRARCRLRRTTGSRAMTLDPPGDDVGPARR